MKQALILTVGKLKDRGLQDLCRDYFKRCSSLVKIEVREVRDLKHLEKAIPGKARLVLLDERGQQMTSPRFAEFIQDWMVDSPAILVFAIGGANGFTDNFRKRADVVLSFGKMTFAHRLARVMLAEQLYRAVSILLGFPYHRGD